MKILDMRVEYYPGKARVLKPCLGSKVMIASLNTGIAWRQLAAITQTMVEAWGTIM